jgi:hypothetical protein
MVVGSTDTLATGGSVTVTVQVAFFVGSATDSTVIVTALVVTSSAVTRPVGDTLTLLESLLLHVTAWFVALGGATMAVRVSLPPSTMLVLDLFSDTLRTGMVPGPGSTVTAQSW